MQNLAILDDYTGASLNSADWDELKDDFNITVFNSHFSDPATLIKRLKDFEVICAMRERTPFTAEVFEVDSQGALLPIAGGTIVTWEAYWYNADGTLRGTIEILSGTAEELLFSTNTNTYAGSRIAVVAKFNDRQVTKTIEVVAS